MVYATSYAIMILFGILFNVVLFYYAALFIMKLRSLQHTPQLSSAEGPQKLPEAACGQSRCSLLWSHLFPCADIYLTREGLCQLVESAENSWEEMWAVFSAGVTMSE